MIRLARGSVRLNAFSPERLQDKTLVQRANELMYELTKLYPPISGVMPEYGWDVPLAHAMLVISINAQS